MKTLIIIVLLAISFSNLQDDSHNLVGKWECYHKEREDGTTKGVDFNDKEFKLSCNGLIIQLNSDFTGSESLGGVNFKYERNDSILKMSDRHYIIELLDKNNLQIRNYNLDKTSLGLSMRLKFKRIK